MPKSTSSSGRVVIVVGLVGAGKSTWLKQQGLPTLSSDSLRATLADDATDQSIHAETFEALRYLLDVRLRLGRPLTYIDATNLKREHRRPFRVLANARGYDAEALFFDIPLEVCLKRNADRDRQVPEAAMRRMAAGLEPPSSQEGFTQVDIVQS